MINSVTRTTDLRQMLGDRQREVRSEVRGRIRDGRTDRSKHVGDDFEHSDTDRQGDVELALLQMRAETLSRIDSALVRLDAGQYGFCCECEREIAERRLRALPFAVRCQACEERREQEHRHVRQVASGRGSLWLFSDVFSS